ncbi:DNA ligase 1-like [Salvia splendens]|uniref:DNA ligase 1-like n=1 Tax=Salvia splendens TaxID=180675 RepID=UPI001C27F6D4|nr:DNA ligase 1-like [Salvia splendens]
MSRCFPFPPPGYERKHLPEDVVLLKEAKPKEYKEKKEKKDERKKDKEKKEKDGKEKYRDKKDRKGKHKDKKEKHRDKKREKDDRGKDKDKSSVSEESTVSRKLEERSGENLQPEGNNKHSRFEDEGKCSPLLQGQNGKKPSQSILPSQAINGARSVQELNRWIQDEEKGGGSQFLQRVANVGIRDQGAAPRNNDGDKSFHVKKVELQGCNGVFTGKATVLNLGVGKSKNEGIPRPLEVQNDSRLEEKEKYKEAWGNNKQGDKQKDRDKKSHRKDKHKEKEKEKKKEVANANIESKKSESQNSGKKYLVDATFSKNENLHEDVVGAATNEASIKKRKDMDTNGFLHDGEIRPNKVQRLSPTENGRISTKFSSFMHNIPNKVWSDHGGQLNNGINEAKKPSPSKANHPSGVNKLNHQIFVPPKTPDPAPSNVNEPPKMHKMKDHAAEASRRPPHPDSKYLSRILAVPTVGDWSEEDGQEWLLSKNGHPNKPKLEPAGVKEELQVWSEAVHIKSADVCALPYVIPY